MNFTQSEVIRDDVSRYNITNVTIIIDVDDASIRLQNNNDFEVLNYKFMRPLELVTMDNGFEYFSTLVQNLGSKKYLYFAALQSGEVMFYDEKIKVIFKP